MLEDFLIGNYTDQKHKTGVTVLLAPEGATGGVSVRGGAPATHETELFRAENTVEKVNAVLLSGGSAFGLEAVSGAMTYLYEKGKGYDAGGFRVPICAGASIYDLECGSFAYPTKEDGYAACLAAKPLEEIGGAIGGGTGATVAKMGGMASAFPSGMAVAMGRKGEIEMAVVTVVNALGNVYDPVTGAPLCETLPKEGAACFSNTTISCILTNALLTKAQANKLSDVTQDAYAKCIRPVHTLYDGDTVFTLASGRVKADLLTLQMLADELTCKAILHAVRSSND
ncbi:MAG: P1 family peptidase [Clostridia bacterium]|nr:P1 family peptidase [Clostridia bacterium]